MGALGGIANGSPETAGGLGVGVTEVLLEVMGKDGVVDESSDTEIDKASQLGNAQSSKGSVRPVWTGHGPDPFASDDEEADGLGPLEPPGLGLSQNLSRMVSVQKFEEQRVTCYVLSVCVVAACGGLLFGYSLAITSGLAAMDAFVDKFFADSSLGGAPPSPPPPAEETGGVTYCTEGGNAIGFYTSSLFLAGTLASPVTYWSSNRLGRRGSILIAGLTFLVGSALQTCAVHVSMLYIGRIFTGIAVSFANQSVPVFLSEMAPPKLRGALSMCFQFAVTLGILVSQVLTYLMNEVSAESGWRYALALSMIPAVIVLLGGAFLPDTPNSLVQRGKLDQGRKVLERIRGSTNVAVEFMDIVEAARSTAAVAHGPSLRSAPSEHQAPSWRAIIRPDHRPQLVIAIIVPVIQQLTGANAVLFYAPLIFQTIGASTQSALISNVILGATNVVATIVAVVVVDRMGRKPLLLEGLIQMLLAMLVMCAALALAPESGTLSSSLSAVLLSMLLIFFSGYAWSWAGLAWIIPNEVQPLDSRSTGQAVAVLCNFAATFVVGQTFPLLLCAMEWRVYLFYGVFTVLGIVFTLMFIPETKGLGIEDIYFLFTGHWFWRRFFSEDQKRSVVLQAEGRGLQQPGGRLSVYMSRRFSQNVPTNIKWGDT